MKRIVLAVLVSSMLIIPSGLLYAASRKAEQQAQARMEAERVANNAMRKQTMQRVTDLLNSKEWIVYHYPSGVSAGKKLPVLTDILTFKDGKVASKILTARGFNESNYTLTVSDSGTAVFETMQRTEKEDLAFWRGELRGDNLTGLLNIQTAKGLREEYNFGMNPPPVSAPEKKKR
jgi:hypothetical protein